MNSKTVLLLALVSLLALQFDYAEGMTFEINIIKFRGVAGLKFNVRTCGNMVNAFICKLSKE